MSTILVFIFSTVLIFGASDINSHLILKIFAPLIICIFLVPVFSVRPFQKYLFFFVVSITSLLGLTQTLTGSHAEYTNPYLYGLSFYMTSLAFYAASLKSYTYLDAFKITNPLLLVTGPIVLFVKDRRTVLLSKRVNYYLPFVLVGIFFYQIIAIPLTKFFFIKEATDLVSSLLFSIIFELFVYTNFCGLSLIVFGVFGLIGYRIPLNFNQPFSSTNMVDFWRGWHTSLSRVLKLLFYNPLRAKYSMSVAIFGVYLSSAIWHGVSVNFLLWGVFHAGVFLISIKFMKRGHKMLPFALLVFGVIFGRLLFAEPDTSQLIEKLHFRFNDFTSLTNLLHMPTTSLMSLMLVIILVCVEFFMRKNKYVRKRNYKHLRSPIALTIISLIGIFLVSNAGINYAVYGQR
jgi:alginate O-acetyltransferase complex protein AlgI